MSPEYSGIFSTEVPIRLHLLGGGFHAQCPRSSHCTFRTQWITEQLGMVACVGSRIWWTWRVEDAFERIEQGDKNALRDEVAIQRQQVTCCFVQKRSSSLCLTPTK